MQHEEAVEEALANASSKNIRLQQHQSTTTTIPASLKDDSAEAEHKIFQIQQFQQEECQII